MTDRLETHVQLVNNVTTVQLEALTVALTGLQPTQGNHSQVAKLVPVATLLVHLVLLVESGLLRDLLVMIVLLVESGLLRDLLVMIVLLVVNGLQNVQLVMTELLVESGQMTVVQEIHVDQTVLLEMTTVREVLMVQETSHLTRRLSLKMSF
jgi:hypothetical protein